MTYNKKKVPVIHRDKMLRLLDRKQYSSFQTLYKEIIDNAVQIEAGDRGDVAIDNQNEVNENNAADEENASVGDQNALNDNANIEEPSQDSGHGEENNRSSESGQDESSGNNTQDSGAATGNEELNQSFREEIENPSQGERNLRHPRRSGQRLSAIENPSLELRISNALNEERSVDYDLSQDLGFFSNTF